jgi:hypothetical protein
MSMAELSDLFTDLNAHLLMDFSQEIVVKISQLIKKLQSFDADKEIYCYAGDGYIEVDHRKVQIFDISEVSEFMIEKCEDEHGLRRVKFRDTPNSSKILLLEITCDF